MGRASGHLYVHIPVTSNAQVWLDFSSPEAKSLAGAAGNGLIAGAVAATTIAGTVLAGVAVGVYLEMKRSEIASRDTGKGVRLCITRWISPPWKMGQIDVDVQDGLADADPGAELFSQTF